MTEYKTFFQSYPCKNVINYWVKVIGQQVGADI